MVSEVCDALLGQVRQNSLQDIGGCFFVWIMHGGANLAAGFQVVLSESPASSRRFKNPCWTTASSHHFGSCIVTACLSPDRSLLLPYRPILEGSILGTSLF
jgi:hypothetical protein